MSVPISLVVHGGAWAIPDSDVAETEAGLAEAVAAGWAVLSAGGSALDAVEAAVRVLERVPVFDAGIGSVLNARREVECDALVVDGRTLASGAVIGLNNVLHPVSVARRLMERTPHAIVAGAGAREFAHETAPPEERCDEAALVTPAACAAWEQEQTYAATIDASFAGRSPAAGGSARPQAGHDTVGAVALDSAGHVASATSTGGITMKMRGRVGDSPVVGSGGYADDAEGASSTTGHGESILKCLLAARALGVVRTPAALPSAAGGCAASCDGSPAQRAASTAVSYMRSRVDGFGGVIVVLPDGDVGAAYTTPRMAWGYATGRTSSGSGEDSASGTGSGSPPLRSAVGVSLGGSDTPEEAQPGPRWRW